MSHAVDRLVLVPDDTDLSRSPLAEHPDAPTYVLGNVRDVVFTTGIADDGDHVIVTSGEADLACRITHIGKDSFR